ncbi:hypothetical protein BD311DRAFT_229799 [Dichomitus squalens]|uniref:Uncharacterized protein n=1 Tax=Dichomitus squalens TaxID=114155 RepID=A0A4Q9M6N6_9APHY|nr:hypothetical protein BD311DRAFT_229799 [Dichomitus squalens]
MCMCWHTDQDAQRMENHNIKNGAPDERGTSQTRCITRISETHAEASISYSQPRLHRSTSCPNPSSEMAHQRVTAAVVRELRCVATLIVVNNNNRESAFQRPAWTAH